MKKRRPAAMPHQLSVRVGASTLQQIDELVKASADEGLDLAPSDIARNAIRIGLTQLMAARKTS